MTTIRRRTDIRALVALLLVAVGCDDQSSSTNSAATTATSSPAAPDPTTTGPPTIDSPAPTTDSPATTDAEPGAPLPVILDYSPTVSDVGALLYLASQPDVDLLAVTLAGTGEADCDPGVRATRALLELAGRPAVPVGCGRDEPLTGDRDWPEEWRAAANAIADLELPDVPAGEVIDAETLLATTLGASERKVTLITLGPLTNVGAVLAAQPQLVERLEKIVVMGGAIRAGGNVERAPTAEWNLYIDPESVRLTVGSGAPVLFVALDATNDVPWTATLTAQIGTVDTDAARFEHQLLSAGPLDGIYLWDELAAMAAVDPTLVTTERFMVIVDDDGALVRDPAGTMVEVAIEADASAATSELLRILSGGTAPTFEPLDNEQLAYFDALAAATATFQLAFGRIFEEGSSPDTEVTALVGIYASALTELDSGLRSVEPPSSFAGRHDALVESLSAAIALTDELTALTDQPDGDAPLEQFFSALEELQVDQHFRLFLAECRVMEAESVARGGPPVCESLDDG